jgi:hypothetical protein
MKTVFVTASFMSLGLCEGTGHGFFDRVLDHWDNGCYELIYRLTSYAPYACALIAAGYQSAGSFPGVADYEISEAFGVWFGQEILGTDEAGMDPVVGLCQAKLLELTTAFFGQGMDDTDTGRYERAKLREALADVPVKCEPATLQGAVAQFVLELDRIGFGTDHPISGAMCVDVVNENLSTLREFIA